MLNSSIPEWHWFLAEIEIELESGVIIKSIINTGTDKISVMGYRFLVKISVISYQLKLVYGKCIYMY